MNDEKQLVINPQKRYEKQKEVFSLLFGQDLNIDQSVNTNKPIKNPESG